MNKNKAKGTRAESKIVKYLNDHGIKAERRALAGSKDVGDIFLPEYNCILEVKTGKQTYNYSRQMKKEWLRQTLVEIVNADAEIGFLIIATYRKSIGDYEVWSPSGVLFNYLDEFVSSFENVKKDG